MSSFSIDAILGDRTTRLPDVVPPTPYHPIPPHLVMRMYGYQHTMDPFLPLVPSIMLPQQAAFMRTFQQKLKDIESARLHDMEAVKRSQLTPSSLHSDESMG